MTVTAQSQHSHSHRGRIGHSIGSQASIATRKFYILGIWRSTLNVTWGGMKRMRNPGPNHIMSKLRSYRKSSATPGYLHTIAKQVHRAARRRECHFCFFGGGIGHSEGTEEVVGFAARTDDRRQKNQNKKEERKRKRHASLVGRHFRSSRLVPHCPQHAGQHGASTREMKMGF